MTIDPVNFEPFVSLGESLGELEVTMGPIGRPVIAELRTRLAEAGASHRNGDTLKAIDIIRGAMERLAALASTLDPAEAVLMLTMSEHFSNSLRVGDKHTANNAVNVMHPKAGTPKSEPSSYW